MKAAFWFTAGVLTGLTAAATLYLTIGSPTSLRAAATTAAAPRATGNESGAGKALSMEDATARLQGRLEREGGNPDDWELLAKSYEFLGRPAEAARARQHITSNAPTTGDGSTARVASVDMNMPSASELAMGTQILRSAESDTTESPGGSSRPEISGTVSVESRLAGRIERGATLFIYAKAVDSPGPPLAVLRLTAGDWPVSFHLDDSMAMLPSRRLSQFQKIIVEARISRSGQAAPAAGDLYVTSTVISPSSGKKLALVINHEIG